MAKVLDEKDTTITQPLIELVSVIYISNWFILICIFLPISFEMCEKHS